MIPLMLRSCAFGLILCAAATAAWADTHTTHVPGLIGDEERYDPDTTVELFDGNLMLFRQMSTGEFPDPGISDPNGNKFLFYMIEVLEESIRILKAREYIAARLYKDVLGDWHPSSQHHANEKIVAYSSIRFALNQKKMPTTDRLVQYKAMADKYGRVPEEYYRELTATLRPEPIRPPFRIGEVVVETTDRSDRITDASNRLNQARNAVESGQKLLDETRAEFEEEEARFWEIYNREQERIRPLEEAYRSQMDPLLRAERDRIASISATTAAEADRIERMQRRVEVIGERLSLADEVYGGPENARIQKARLAAERDDLVARLARIDAGPRSRTEDQLRATSERAEELFDRWDLEKRHSDRVIARAGRDLEMVANQVRRLRADVASDENELGEAIAEWQDVKDDSELAIGQVSSVDYRARFVSELPDLAKLNSLIAEMRQGISRAELAHERARREMLDQGRSVTAASENLIRSSYASALAQTEVEFIDQWLGFLGTTVKAGPHAALAEAVHTMFWNVASPPTVFDASSSPFSTTAKEDNLVEKVLTEGAKVASKMYPIDQKVREDTAALIESRLSRQLGDRMPDIRAGNLDAVDGLSEELKKQLKGLKEIQEEIDVYGFQKGVKKLATTLSLDIAKGQIVDAAKGYVKDEIKKLIAEWLEGPAVGRYLEEQIQLVHAVRKFRVSGNMAWHLRDQLALLVPEREAFLARYDSEADMLVDKNRQFLAEAGYTFYLYSSDYTDIPDEDDTPRDLDAKVYLQGIELVEEPSKYGQKFSIRAEDEERFDSSLPEMLTLTIKLQ